MPIAYTDDSDATDTQLVRQNLKSIPVQVVNVVDPDTAERRFQKAKAAREAYRLKQEQLQVEVEEGLARQRKINERLALQELRGRGWEKHGFPGAHQKFYEFRPCDFCGLECAYIIEKSPNIGFENITLPFSKEHKDEWKNYPDLHLCSNYETKALVGIIHYLLKKVHSLEIEDKKFPQMMRDTVNQAAMLR